MLQLGPKAEKYTAGAGQRAISHLPGVDLHPKLIHLKRIFASKFDPRVDAIPPIKGAGGQRSDRRGDREGWMRVSSTQAESGRQPLERHGATPRHAATPPLDHTPRRNAAPRKAGRSRRPPESSPPSPGRSSSASDHRPSRLSAALSRAGSVACYAAGFLVAVAALLALPLQAQAQTVQTMVSNTRQTPSDRTQYLSSLDGCTRAAQGFTTCDSEGEHTLSSVDLYFSDIEATGGSGGKHLRSGRIRRSWQQPGFYLSNSTTVADGLNHGQRAGERDPRQGDRLLRRGGGCAGRKPRRCLHRSSDRHRR